MIKTGAYLMLALAAAAITYPLPMFARCAALVILGTLAAITGVADAVER